MFDTAARTLRLRFFIAVLFVLGFLLGCVFAATVLSPI